MPSGARETRRAGEKLGAVARAVVPKVIREAMSRITPQRIIRKLQIGGVIPHAAETSKAKARRTREGFFESYCQGPGLDIGHGGDFLTPDCDGWELEQGDAQYLEGVEDGRYAFVYSSHTLEHVCNPGVALRNWARVLAPGGYLILYIPHRDLYEKRRHLPSRWNDDHKHFFLPERHDPPDTLGVVPLLEETLPNLDLVYVKVCDEGHTIDSPQLHSDGEYSIEVVARKTVNQASGRE